MNDPLRNTVRGRLGAIILAFTIGLGVGLVVTETATAHTPRPIACKLAWEQAPAGGKWAAQQRCKAAQQSHVRKHRVQVQVAKARRICIHYGWQLGTGMCHAIARVKPAWAGRWAYHELLDRESSGDPNAVNDSSDACGAFQRLVRKPHHRGGRGCPWAFSVVGYSGRKRIEVVHASALEQTRNGVRYIEGRYGSPEAAVRFHNANGWY